MPQQPQAVAQDVAEQVGAWIEAVVAEAAEEPDPARREAVRAGLHPEGVAEAVHDLFGPAGLLACLALTPERTWRRARRVLVGWDDDREPVAHLRWYPVLSPAAPAQQGADPPHHRLRPPGPLPLAGARRLADPPAHPDPADCGHPAPAPLPVPRARPAPGGRRVAGRGGVPPGPAPSGLQLRRAPMRPGPAALARLPPPRHRAARSAGELGGGHRLGRRADDRLGRPPARPGRGLRPGAHHRGARFAQIRDTLRLNPFDARSVDDRPASQLEGVLRAMGLPPLEDRL